MKSENLFLHSLKAISPIDGRHRLMTEPLADWFSEFALFKYRLYLEIEYLIALSEWEGFATVRNFNLEEKKFLKDIINNFTLEDAQSIQDKDRFGSQGQGPLNHDVKACEYYLKEKMMKSSLQDMVEMVHFGLTSEDANNIAFSSMIKGVLKYHYVPAVVQLLEKLRELAETEKDTAMLSKTHGQPATPTTFGKEMANYLERLRKELLLLQNLKLPAKANGAVGTHAAQHFAAPEVDWISFTEKFLTELGFEANLFSTQIEPHDGLSHLFGTLISINNILRDLAIDFWMYISANYLTQKKLAGEVGSSTMPHKINPWRMEVAEGSTVEANFKFYGFMQKLQVSRLQRDLSDHEAERAIGVGLAHSYLAVLHIIEELGRLSVNREAILNDLQDQGSILTEAVQTLLRKEGYAQPYELMNNFSRGKNCTVEELHQFIEQLNLKENIKEKIKKLRPENYTGLASRLTEIALKRWKEFYDNYKSPLEPVKEILFDCSSFPTKWYEELQDVTEKMQKKGIRVIGINSSEEQKRLFTEIVTGEEAVKKATSGKTKLFVGRNNELFREAQTNGWLCVNTGTENDEKRADYNIISLTELLDLINSLNELL